MAIYRFKAHQSIRAHMDYMSWHRPNKAQTKSPKTIYPTFPLNLFLVCNSSSSMESPNASWGPPPNPITRLSTFIHRLSTDLSRRLAAVNFPAPSPRTARIPANLISPARDLPFASVSQAKQAAQSVDSVAKRLIGTAVYTVSNSSNEFVLMSDPDGVKSIGLLCFRKEDAEAFLSQVAFFASYLSKIQVICIYMWFNWLNC